MRPGAARGNGDEVGMAPIAMSTRGKMRRLRRVVSYHAGGTLRQAAQTGEQSAEKADDATPQHSLDK